MTGATGNFYCGLQRFFDMALLLHYFGGTEPQGSFLDLGANAGSYTILASAVCGVHSISLEPVPSTFARLMRNLRANDITGRVDARCIAAGAAAGSLRFSADCDTTNQVVDDGYAGAAMEVQVEPVDKVLGGRIPISCFWKVDVEGFEGQVLKGAAESLGNPAVEVVLLEADGDAIASVMTAHGFQRITYDPFKRKVAPVDERSPHQNHVWMRDPDAVRLSRSFTASGVSF